MESEQSGTFGGGGEDSSGSDTLSEGETQAEPYESQLHFEDFKCQSSDFVGLDDKVKGIDSDECSNEIKARNGDYQEEGENDGDEDEMVDLPHSIGGKFERGHKKRSSSRSRSPRWRARSPSPSKRGKKDKKRDRGRDSSRERTEISMSRRKSRDYEPKSKPSLMERGYEPADHEYDSDMDGLGSVGSDDRSPQAHLNGSYRSTYVEEYDLSAAE